MTRGGFKIRFPARGLAPFSGREGDSNPTSRSDPALDFLPHRGNLSCEGVPVSDIPFHQTAMGRDFYDRNLPELVRQVTRLNDLLERLLARLDEGREDR